MSCFSTGLLSLRVGGSLPSFHAHLSLAPWLWNSFSERNGCYSSGSVSIWGALCLRQQNRWKIASPFPLLFSLVIRSVKETSALPFFEMRDQRAASHVDPRCLLTRETWKLLPSGATLSLFWVPPSLKLIFRNRDVITCIARQYLFIWQVFWL